MSDQNKIDEIKEALAAATPGRWHVQPGEYYDAVYSSQDTKLTVVINRAMQPDARFIAKSPEYITYLLQEAEFWKQAAENQRENNYELLKKQAILKDALEEIELILTDDTSTQAIEINQVINRAREAL